MKQPYFVSHLPAVLNAGMFYNLETGKTSHFLVLWRLLSTMFLLALNIYGWRDSYCGDKTFAKLHDAMVFVLFLSNEFVFLKNKSQVSVLVKSVLTPLPYYRAKTHHARAVIHYWRRLNFWGISIGLGYTMSVVFYIIVPFIVTLLPSNKGYQPFYASPSQWVPSSLKTNTVTVLTYTIWLPVCISEIALFFSWTVALIVCILKIQLKIRLLIADLLTLDERVEHNFDQVLWSGTTCIYCNKCKGTQRTNQEREMTNFLTRGKRISMFSSARDSSRECCKEVYREKILRRCIKEMVEKHLAIIRLVRLVDKCFHISLLSYNQLASFIAVLVIPKVTKPPELTVTEYLQRGIEVVGTFQLIGIFYYCGQIILNESDMLRRALYECTWVGKSCSFQRSILLMMTMANKPLRITAGGMHTVSMESFTKIVSAIYSYASLMQSLKGSEA